jgi:uncharacterized protein DUF4112
VQVLRFRRDRMTQLAQACRVTHLVAMSNEQTVELENPRLRGRSGRAFRGTRSRGPIIDQEGREIPEESLEQSRLDEGLADRFQRFGFDFRHSSANPFGVLTREQRLARLETLAKLLDIAFLLPGTKVRYGVDGIIRLIPLVGDLVATAFSLWLVSEARALGAPWHVTARMLGNVAVDGIVGMVPLAGDAFDVLFRANMRNVRLLRRWLDRQPRAGGFERSA